MKADRIMISYRLSCLNLQTGYNNRVVIESPSYKLELRSLSHRDSLGATRTGDIMLYIQFNSYTPEQPIEQALPGQYLGALY